MKKCTSERKYVGLLNIPKTEAEWREAQREQEKYLASYEEERARKKATLEKLRAVWRVVAFVLFTPFVICFNVLAVILRFCGSALAIGLPYGLYCLYKTIVQLKAGVALADISQTIFVCVFVIAPFVAFALSALFIKLADFLEYQTL